MAAGLGFKTFTTGEVLTAADTNGYLMQGVLVFASAAARDAAITSPQEGQCCYLKDTDAVLTYSGSAWVGFDDSNAIQNSIVDAKGDIVAASAADTPARLAVGNNGETLVADSSTSTGLRYQSAYNGNVVINGGMDIWQRGTSFTGTTTAYGADRWRCYRNTTGSTFSRQASSLTGIQYSQRIQRDVGTTATNGISVIYTAESADAYRFAGQTITLSFYARAGSNFSAASSAMFVNMQTGTGTDQSYGSFTGGVNAIVTTQVITTSWVRYSFNATCQSTITQFALDLGFTPVGTAGAADYIEITGVQLELGSVATAFKRSNGAGGTIQGELAACQRYFYKSPELSVVPGAATSSGLIRGGTNSSGNRWIGAFCLPVTMRVNPTCVVYNPNNGTAGQMRNEDASTNVTVSGIFGQYTNTVTQIDFSPTTSANNVVVGYITASAEL